MPRSKFVAAVVISSAMAAASAAPAFAADGHRAPHPKFTMSQARAIATKAFPSAKIMQAELEHERGGSGLRYSFVVKRGAKAYEVGIDAQSGAILENQVEGPNAD